MKSSIQLFILILLCTISFSCTNSSTTLIGEWLRSDINSKSEYRLTLEQDSTGYISNKETTKEGVISNALSINWNISNNFLIINKNEEVITTRFEFLPNGNLLLADFSDFEFIKQ